MRIPWPGGRLAPMSWGASMTLRAAVAGLCVLVIAIGLACGDDVDDSKQTDGGAPTQPAPPSNVVTDSEIQATPAASPQRSLLRLLQAVQFQDFQAARELITLGQRRSLGRQRLRNVITLVGPALGKPRVVAVRRDGNRAVARVLILSFAPGKSQPSSSTPASFPMVRAGGEWRASDLSYLIQAATDIGASKRRDAAPRR